MLLWNTKNGNTQNIAGIFIFMIISLKSKLFEILLYYWILGGRRDNDLY